MKRFNLEIWFLHSHVLKLEDVGEDVIAGLRKGLELGAIYSTINCPDGASLTINQKHLVTLKVVPVK